MRSNPQQSVHALGGNNGRLEKYFGKHAFASLANRSTIATLDAFIAESRSFSRAASMRRKYVNEFHIFDVWCRRHVLDTLPVTPSTVERYCAVLLLSKEEPTPGPILYVLPTIAKFHELRSLCNPCANTALKDFVGRLHYGDG